MSFTVQNLCDEALRLIHVLRANASFATQVQGGNTVPACQEYQIALDALNQVIDGFSVDGATVYQVVHETFALTGAASYTWGLGGVINTARPEKIRAAAVIQSTTASMRVAIVTPEKFETIIDISRAGKFADMLVCDYANPLATISLWPIVATGTLDLWSIKPLTAVVYLSDAISFPPGYLETLKLNLAVMLASEFPTGRLDQWVFQKAGDCKARLAALNMVTIGEPMPPLPPLPIQQPVAGSDIAQGSPQRP